MPESKKRILVCGPDNENNFEYLQAISEDFEVVQCDQYAQPNVPDHIGGVVFQAHESALPWLAVVQGRFHWASFLEEGVDPNDIDLDLDEQLRPVASTREALLSVIAAIREDALEANAESLSDDQNEIAEFNLESLVKVPPYRQIWKRSLPALRDRLNRCL